MRCECRSGHSSQSAGKPRTRRRAVASQRLSSRKVIASLMNIRRSTEREGAMKSKESDNLRSNLEGGM